jgi:hypothetical protein
MVAKGGNYHSPGLTLAKGSCGPQTQIYHFPLGFGFAKCNWCERIYCRLGLHAYLRLINLNCTGLGKLERQLETVRMRKSFLMSARSARKLAID